jgi:hypothetical protein
MWALVESNEIKEIIRNSKPMTIGNVQYPSNIFSSWSSSDLEAIGLYEITIDYDNLKDEKYYVNGDIVYTYASNAVTGAYPSAVAKPLNDVLWLDSDDKPAGVSTGDVKVEGLKNIGKRDINAEANSLLSRYDWYTLRAADGGTAVPSNIATYRAAVRTAANSMCTKIDSVSTVDELAAQYVYDTSTPPARPLGEWPVLGE